MKHCKKYFLLQLLLLCITAVCTAQNPPRNLLSHFTEQQVADALIPLSQWHPFPRTTKEWQDILPDSIRMSIIKKAEAELGQPFESLPASLMLDYVRNGNRTRYEAIFFKKRSHLFDLVLAEAIEQKGRFLNAITDGIWSICEESFWGVPAHLGLQKAGEGLADVEDPVVDLFAAETAGVLALTDYFTGSELDTLSPLLRKRIYYEANRRIFDPLEKNSGRYWYFGERTNNWNPWITSNWMLSLLLLEKNEKRRASELHHAMTLNDIYTNKLGDDGAADEGPSYWFEAGGRLLDGLSILSSATNGRISIFKEPFIRAIASYIYKTHIAGDYFISVADAAPVIDVDALLIYRFGKATGDTILVNFGSWAFHKNGNQFNHGAAIDRLWNFTVMKECAAQPGNEPLLEDVWLKNVQLMSARSGNGLYVASHAGNNGESHNHNDVGDFIVYAYGEPVIIDVGSGTYTAKTFSKDRYTLWYNASAYHNLPTINGFQQQDGRQFEAKGVAYVVTNGKAQLQMDIASAYPADASVKQWMRTVTMDKKQNKVIVKDNFIANGNIKELTQSFMTVCQANIDQPGKIIFDVAGKKVVMAYDAGKWSVSKKDVLTHTPDEKRLEDNWRQRPVWRILLTYKRTAQKDNFIYSFIEEN